MSSSNTSILPLEARSTQFDALFEQAPDGIFVADADARYVQVNDAGCRMLGLSRDEIVGKSAIDFIPPEDVERLWKVRRRILQGEVVVTEWRLRHKDGTFVAVESSAKMLPDGRWQAFVRDISERKRLESSLRMSEERLRLALRASPAVVWNQDTELRYTWIHNPVRPYAASDFLGKTDYDLLPPDEAERLASLKREVLHTGVGVRDVARATMRSETMYYDVFVEPLRDERGDLVGITGAAWNVTAQRRAEEEHRFLAEVGEVLMTAAPDYQATLTQLGRLAVREVADWAIVDVVEHGRIRRLNVACSDESKSALAQRLARLPLDRTRPHLVLDAIERRRAMVQTVVTRDYLESISQSPEHFEILCALEPKSLAAAPLLARGRLLGALCLVSSRSILAYRERDLSFVDELARLSALAVDNAQLYSSRERAIAARDEILGVVAHDLRNPLNTILSQIEILRRTPKVDADAGVQGGIGTMQRAVVRMNRMIQDMLDVARLEGGPLAIERVRLVPDEILEEARDAHEDAASRAGISLRLDMPPALPEICGDRDRLLQILDNLVDNALKFTPRGGEVVLGATVEAGDVLFRVGDTGAGIPKNHLAHLFDRFWQAKRSDRRGAGLGLPIVKGIVEAHGGRVRVESRRGKGTTIFFTVPVA